MTGQSATPSGSDKRVHPRVPMALAGRIWIGAHQKLEECVVVDLSAGGAGLQQPFEVPRSGLICVLEIAGFGKFDGITAHYGSATLGVRFLFGEAERLSLIDKLSFFVLEGVTAGVAEVLPDRSRPAQVRTASGQVTSCEVMNISLREALLRAPAKPAIGEMVSVGRAYGRVVLHHPEGFGVEFLQFMSR